MTGAATLVGTLDVTRGGGFSPNISDTFATTDMILEVVPQ
jgi:hypothetical protein